MSIHRKIYRLFSGSTYAHATKVLEITPASIIEATHNNELSINAAYTLTKLPEEQQAEIAKRIEQGEPAKVAIAEEHSRHHPSELKTSKTCEICEFYLLAIRGTLQRATNNIPQLVAHIMKDARK